MSIVTKIANSVLDLLLPILKPVFVRVLAEVVFPAFKQANEDAYRTALVALYPIIDVQLEDLAIKTETEIDNAAVDILKEAIEKSAEASGFLDELPNLDED